MPLLLKDIRTGEGFGHARIAEIYAPEHAGAGSLAILTRFLNEQEGLRAIPGYDERNGEYILRVSGFKDDASLNYLLERELPLWLTEHHLPKDIALSEQASFTSIDEVRLFPHQPPLQRFVKSHASQLAGLSYMAGNLGLLYSAWNNPAAQPDNMLSEHQAHDCFKAYSGAAYMTATLLLLCFAREADKPRDVRSIVADAYQALSHENKTMQEDNTLRQKLTESLQFIQTHPWEITACLNASGALAHVISAGLRMSSENHAARYEALSALGTLTAMTLVALAPTEQDISCYAALASDNPQFCDTMAALQPIPQESASPHQRMHSFREWIGQHAMQLASSIQSISNIGYGFAALRQPQKDIGLLTASAGYLMGNLVQTQADKVRGAAYDDIVTSAARLLVYDNSLEGKTDAELQEIIHAFAGELHAAHDVTHSTEQLEQGISSRLYAIRSPEQQAPNLARYNSEELAQLKESPFVGAAYLEQLRAEQSASARSAFMR